MMSKNALHLVEWFLLKRFVVKKELLNGVVSFRGEKQILLWVCWSVGVAVVDSKEAMNVTF